MNIIKEQGVVYTPEWIVKEILDLTGYSGQLNKSIIDPSCGDGAFLREVVRRLLKSCKKVGLNKNEVIEILEKNVVGLDIDKNAINACKNKLNILLKELDFDSEVKWKLCVLDSLKIENTRLFAGNFDFVVGNPPYIRIQNLGENKTYIQKNWSFCSKGSTDIFFAFFELGISLLNQGGKLGYITPNTYLTSSAGRIMRDVFLREKLITKFVDFEDKQLFDGITTYSLITVLEKGNTKPEFILYKGDDRAIKKIEKQSYHSLMGAGWVLHPSEVLKRIQRDPTDVLLGDVARIHVGLTTLADSYYIFDKPRFNGDEAEIMLKDGRRFLVEKAILKPIVKASTLKKPTRQDKYIIFPYKKIKGKNVVIPEAELKSAFPRTYSYFLAIKDILMSRDKGKGNAVAWYAFGRSQGLDTSFGKKIVTSPMNKEPNFIVWEDEDVTFYSGYCIKFDGDLNILAKHLNSDKMNLYIKTISRSYQNGYKSYSKSYLKNFPIKLNRMETRQARLV